MKQFTSQLQDELISKLQTIDLEWGDILQQSTIAVTFLEEVFNKLKAFILGYPFSNQTEEIYFFKEIKPHFFCKLVYYQEICNLETMCPTGSDAVQKNYILKRLDQLKDFFDNNLDFYKYYRTGCTHLDHYYFLRRKPDILLTLDNFYFERDAQFSTSHDFKVTKILANELLQIYLKSRLAKLENSQFIEQSYTDFPKAKETWTGDKVHLIELIYSIHETRSINYGKTDIKKLVTYFENIFNIDLGDAYRTFLQMRGRKINRTVYLDLLKENLIRKMDLADQR